MMSQESAITFWGVCSIITTIFTIFALAAYIINRRRDEKKKREGIYISRVQGLLAYIIVFIPGFPIIRYFLSLNGPETNPYTEGICIFMTAFLLFYLWHVNATYMKISSEGINMHTPIRGSRICLSARLIALFIASPRMKIPQAGCGSSLSRVRVLTR